MGVGRGDDGMDGMGGGSNKSHQVLMPFSWWILGRVGGGWVVIALDWIGHLMGERRYIIMR